MGWMGSHNINIKMMNVRQDSVNRHSRSTAHILDIQSLSTFPSRSRKSISLSLLCLNDSITDPLAYFPGHRET